MTRRIFELNCQCSVFRNEIEVEIKGVKGKLKKIIIKEYFHSDPQLIQSLKSPIEVSLKQTNLKQYFNKPQKQTINSLNKPDKLPNAKKINDESRYMIIISQGPEKMYEYNVKNIVKINKNFINDGKLTLIVQDVQIIDGEHVKIEKQLTLFISNSTPQSLHLFLDQLNRIKQGNIPPGITEPPDVDVPEQIQQKLPNRQLNEMQIMKLKRKGIDVSQYQQIPQTQDKKQMLPKQQSIPALIVKKLDFARFIIRQVISFLPQNKILQHRVISKAFDEEVRHKRIMLNFDRHLEVPTDILVGCLNKFYRVEQINLGRLKNIQTKVFLDLQIPTFSFLKILEMSQYSYLTDKLAEKILSKTERVENLKLHYNSKITNNTIEFIKLRLSNLRRLSLKSKSSEHNDLIHEKVLAQLILFRSNQMDQITIQSVHISFFEHIMQGLQMEASLSNLQELKLKRVFYNDKESIVDYTRFFKQIPQLEKLSINNLCSKSGGYYNISPLLIQAFTQSLEFLKNLISLSIGDFCDDSICAQIGIQLLYLNKSNRWWTRSNFWSYICKGIFTSCTLLEIIDIQGCTSINGHCFSMINDNSENFCQKLLKIRVSFDDYRVKCLEAVLFEKCFLYEIKNSRPKV